jgi:hypothetical protein
MARYCDRDFTTKDLGKVSRIEETSIGRRTSGDDGVFGGSSAWARGHRQDSATHANLWVQSRICDFEAIGYRRGDKGSMDV